MGEGTADPSLRSGLESGVRVDYEKREIVCAVGDLVHESTYRRIGVERAEVEARVGFEHHRDGEPEPEEKRLEVSLLKKALRVLVPKETSEDPEGPFLPG